MELKQQFSAYLQQEIEQYNAEKTIKEAMAYSLISNGKMIRPLIFLHYIKNKVSNIEAYFPVAMAIEMIHVYSLIHDDLPAMDNDDLRRGKATNHIVYGEAIALLAGDSLLTHSFSQLIKAPITAEKKVALVSACTDAIGIEAGMINGQVLDILNEDNVNITETELKTIHYQKTARLIEFALVSGAIITDEEEKIPVLKQIAKDFGIAFQIRDDYLDLYGEAEKIGKAIGKDRENNKKTYVDFYTKSELEDIINKMTSDVKTNALSLNLDSDLIDIFGKLEKRDI